MYNPTYIPKMKEMCLALDSVRYEVVHKNDYVAPRDSRTEGLHIHEYLEIFFNVSSEVSFLVNDKLYPVEKGAAVISRAGDVHVCVYNEARCHEYFCLWIDAPSDNPIMKRCVGDGTSAIRVFDAVESELIRESLDKLCRLKDTEGAELEKVISFLTAIEHLGGSDGAACVPADVPREFGEILNYVKENFDSIRHVREIAELHFVSTSTLNRWFRRYLRCSAHEYLESVKLSHALKLLCSGASVTDACMHSGFSDCSHFIVLFKKKFGKTPLKYQMGS